MNSHLLIFVVFHLGYLALNGCATRIHNALPHALQTTKRCQKIRYPKNKQMCFILQPFQNNSFKEFKKSENIEEII